VFSLPNMSFSLILDGIPGNRRVAHIAVHPNGRWLGMGYLDDSHRNLIVVHRLPGFEVVGKHLLPRSTTNMRFSRSDDELHFSVDNGSGSFSLASLDWRSGSFRNTASIAGWELQESISGPSATRLVLSRIVRKDVWLMGDDRPIRRLTSDGENYVATGSSDGQVLIQRRTLDGRFIISLFEIGDAAPRFVTEGPSDLAPSFSHDGRHWFFVRSEARTIVRCAVGGKCRDIHHDSLSPVWPVASPDGSSVAYVTWMNMPRIRTVSVDGGEPKDLGPALTDCRPVWADSGRLWVLRSAGKNREWVRINSTTGEADGARRSAGTFSPDDSNCELPREGPDSPFFQPVRVVTTDVSEIRRAKADEP
jgi:hypothetical protein